MYKNNTHSGAIYAYRQVSDIVRCAAITAAVLVFAGSACAQGDLEEIVVTAQFRSQNLQDTPIAITAFNAETMEARSQTFINEVASQAPSLTLAPRGAAYGPSMAIYIRGVGQGDFNPAYEPGVGMYVDDVYYAHLTGSIMDLLDLDRVEILRGPQGTLAGRNSIGGAVKLYSREPAGDNTGQISVTYGSRDRLDFRGSGDFAITDSLSARVSAVSKSQDGYVDRLDYGCLNPNSGIPRNMSYNTDCVQAREGEVNYDAVRAILNWDNGGPLAVTVIGDYTNDDRVTGASVLIQAKPISDPNGGPVFVPNADVDPWATGLGLADFVPPPGSYYNYAGYQMIETANRPSRFTDGRSYFRGWGVSGKIEWEINDSLKLESITAYREFDSGFSNDNDLSPLMQQIGDGTLPFWSISEEVRLNGTFGASDQVEWTLGGFYMDQQTKYPSYQDLRYSLPPFQQDDPVDADSMAVFAHVDWQATDELNFVAGLRYTDESKQYQFSRRAPNGGPHPVLGGLDGVVGTYSGDNVDWRVGAQYRWNEDVMTYFQVSTGFKGGGINPRPFYPEQAEGFSQEFLTSYELGAKTELFDHTLRLNGALFYSEYDDIQTGATTCPPQYVVTGPICSLTINAGGAEVKGIELEANWQPMDDVIIDSSMSYVDFEYTEVSALAQGGDIKVGNTAPFTPEWKWSLGAQYTFRMSNGQTLTPRFDVSYNDSVFVNSSNLVRSQIDSYTLANARLTWRHEDSGWEAALEVTNITDEYYFRSIYDAYDRAGVIYGSVGRPREWAFTVKKWF